jgi:hypothetical protein
MEKARGITEGITPGYKEAGRPIVIPRDAITGTYPKAWYSASRLNSAMLNVERAILEFNKSVNRSDDTSAEHWYRIAREERDNGILCMEESAAN